MAIVIVNERTDKTTDKQKKGMIPSFAIKLEIECVSIANEHLLIYGQFLYSLSLAISFFLTAEII